MKEERQDWKKGEGEIWFEDELGRKKIKRKKRMIMIMKRKMKRREREREREKILFHKKNLKRKSKKKK